MKYAIAFDLDTEALSRAYDRANYTNAYGEIKNILLNAGFVYQQGSVYFGDETVDAVKTVMVVQKLARKLPWFVTCVRDIRMLRIEDDNDLLPAIQNND